MYRAAKVEVYVAKQQDNLQPKTQMLGGETERRVDNQVVRQATTLTIFHIYCQYTFRL